MFAYELHQMRGAELRRRADEWRLAREAVAARTAARRARSQARKARSYTAVRGDAEGAPSPRRSGAAPLGGTRAGAHAASCARTPARPRGAV
jgi:hypothetical protein